MLTYKAKVGATVLQDLIQQIVGWGTAYRRIGFQKGEQQLPLADCADYHSEVTLDADVMALRFKEPDEDHWDASSDTLSTEFHYHGAVFSNAYLVGNGVSHISVYDATGKRSEEYSWYKAIKPLPWVYKKPKHNIKGVTLQLCGLTEVIQGNYAHWLIDSLSRLILLEDRCEDPPKFDYLIIPPNKPALRDCVLALGIKDEQLIELETHKCYQFEKLICLSKPRGNHSDIVPGWLIDGYRKRLMPGIDDNSPAPTRKIYISRRDANSRKFAEEERLCEELSQRDYEIVELSNYSLTEKVELFSNASHIIGLSGAGLTSLMFVRSGATVVEIFPSNFVVYIFHSIAAYLNTNYKHYVFKNTSKVGALNRYHGLFQMDVDAFCQFIDQHTR